jgi:hypothetical protein
MSKGMTNFENSRASRVRPMLSRPSAGPYVVEAIDVDHARGKQLYQQQNDELAH